LSGARARAQGVKWGGRLPRVVLLHGTADRCALVGNAQQFAEALRDAGAQARPAPRLWPLLDAASRRPACLSACAVGPGVSPVHRVRCWGCRSIGGARAGRRAACRSTGAI